MQQPLVSILIPFKNTEEFLTECMVSVLGQDYTNWEVIAVNDSSSDQSEAILNVFANKDPRIKVLSNEGDGIIHALRTAYSKANGTLVTRMDSDDIMFSDRLGTMVRSLVDKGRKHLAVGQVKYFSEQGISNGYARYEHWLNKLTESGTNYTEIYKECVIPSPCWMIHKKDLDLCGAFDSNRYPEDYDLTFRFYQHGMTCIPCDKTLHQWRDYSKRTSRTSEHYAQNYFLDIKLHYFLKLDHDQNRPLCIWGAGSKGKTIAKKLTVLKIDFIWVCDNPNKIGKFIYGVKLQHFNAIREYPNMQGIITVANEEAQVMIRSYLNKLGKVVLKDFYFFC